MVIKSGKASTIHRLAVIYSIALSKGSSMEVGIIIVNDTEDQIYLHQSAQQTVRQIKICSAWPDISHKRTDSDSIDEEVQCSEL